jgi:hypothetical protein
MIATDFTRYDCQVGRTRRTYNALRREWCCAGCGGRLVTVWRNERWECACGRCKSQDFVHQNEYARQQAEATEVLAGLPPELRQLIENEKETHAADRP